MWCRCLVRRVVVRGRALLASFSFSLFFCLCGDVRDEVSSPRMTGLSGQICDLWVEHHDQKWLVSSPLLAYLPASAHHHKDVG